LTPGIRMADGDTKKLRDLGGGLAMLLPDEVCVVVVENGNTVTCWTQDEPRRVVVAGTAVGFSTKASNATAGPAGVGKVKGATAETPATPKGRSEDAKRWDTLNEFEDVIAPHLTTAAQSVWHHLFRHCRGGATKSSARDMALNRGIDLKTASKALAHVIAVGLVGYVFKSAHKGERSVFWLHLHPSECREACVAAAAPRKAKQKQRRPPPVRDRASRERKTKKPR
jgi:hypothetical protein